MKHTLSENISRLRRERGMTQEQLAEAMGVSFAAVSKWERGVSAPELGTMLELADLFGVSLDALVGYTVRDNDQQAVIERLRRYHHDRDNEDIYADVEKSLQRYPNCFGVVYHCARIYRMRGFIRGRDEYTRRALGLYHRACLLIGQNTDPEISEISIRNEIAAGYLALGEYDRGLEILKRYNPCQLNHSTIGYTLASVCNKPGEALPYLSMALLDMTQTHMQIVMGYVNVYMKTGNHRDALAMLDWALAFYPGLRASGKQSYIDKCEGSLWAIRAAALLSLKREEDARDSLRRAKALALHFDAAPSYDATNVRFVSIQRPATSFDDLGDTAMLGLDHVIADFSDQPELLELWGRVRDEA